MFGKFFCNDVIPVLKTRHSFTLLFQVLPRLLTHKGRTNKKGGYDKGGSGLAMGKVYCSL